VTFIPKPKVHHPSLQKNALGLTRREVPADLTPEFHGFSNAVAQ